ncbi:hypothetical protein F5Y12DRAFT_800012 [Xylaria sp. FL1777]|nr:hypothetical protein F5Y12DRAFT_800012 [Xylaria sp. FL1777]
MAGATKKRLVTIVTIGDHVTNIILRALTNIYHSPCIIPSPVSQSIHRPNISPPNNTTVLKDSDEALPPEMPQAAAWHVICWEGEEEPEQHASGLPGTEQAYWFKVLVPHDRISEYTKTKVKHGKTEMKLKDKRSHVQCTICKWYEEFPGSTSIGRWAPYGQIRAEWDKLPATNGYYTFYSTAMAHPISPAVDHYYDLEFFVGKHTSSCPQAWFQTCTFQV